MAAARYRPEIDGLRALAVLAVIINHFSKDLLPSGYLGVDIFFVISGYVITASLANRPSTSLAEFLGGFYGRRIRRLLPALVFVVVISAGLITLVDPEPAQALQTGIYSLFGLSNLYLFSQSTDYFAQATELNPFTHTWSLGVEEQFYLLFPLLVWCSGFARQSEGSARRFALWIAVLAAASLVGFVGLYPVNQPAAYFLMPSRFWEMAAGCVLFIGYQQRQGLERRLEQLSPAFILVLMLAVMALPLAAAVPATVVMVLLAGLLLACLKPGTGAFALLTTRPLVYGGLLSYSLYLWHWPVLSLSRWTIGIQWWTLPIQLLATAGMSVLSYRLVETPLRYSQGLGQRWVIPGGLAAAVAGALLLGALDRQAGRLYLRGLYDMAVFPAAHPVHGRPFNPTCVIDGDARRANAHTFAHCTVPPRHAGLPTVWVFGDSHAGHLNGMVVALHQNLGVGYHLIETPGLPFPQVKSPGLPERELLFDQAKAQMAPGDVVLIARNYVNRRTETVAGDFRLWQQRLRGLAQQLEPRGVRVVVMLPTPFFGLNSIACRSTWLSQWSDSCRQSRWQYQALYGRVLRRLGKLASQQSNLVVFDPRPALCTEGAAKDCAIHASGKMLFRDRDHLNLYGSALLAESFADQVFGAHAKHAADAP